MTSIGGRKFLDSVSTTELERRWGVVRKAMKKEGLDFLIARNGSAILGGYVKWLRRAEYAVSLGKPADAFE